MSETANSVTFVIDGVSQNQADVLDEQANGRLRLQLTKTKIAARDFHHLSGDTLQVIVNHADLLLFAAWLAKERILTITMQKLQKDGTTTIKTLSYTEKPLPKAADLLSWLKDITGLGENSIGNGR